MGPRLVLAGLVVAALAGCGSSDNDSATMDAAPGANDAKNLPPPAQKNLPGAKGMMGAPAPGNAQPMAKPPGA